MLQNVFLSCSLPDLVSMAQYHSDPLCVTQKHDYGAALSSFHSDHIDGWTAALKEIISIQNKREMEGAQREW